MIREYSVTLGGIERPLRYRLTDRSAIERALAAANLGTLSIHDTLQDRRIDVQAILIWGGLRHLDRRITPDQVLDWMGEHIAAGNGLRDILEPVVDAVFASGVLGKVIDPDTLGGAGKAEAPATPTAIVAR